jgi:hypothetical protein
MDVFDSFIPHYSRQTLRSNLIGAPLPFFPEFFSGCESRLVEQHQQQHHQGQCFLWLWAKWTGQGDDCCAFL